MIKNEPSDHARIGELLKDTEKIQAVLERAGREAIAEHARAGHQIVVWRDGKVVWEDAQESDQPSAVSNQQEKNPEQSPSD